MSSDSSEEECEGLLKQALHVEFPENFDPNSVPQTGEEYLHHVIYERRNCKKLVTADIDPEKYKNKQTFHVNMIVCFYKEIMQTHEMPIWICGDFNMPYCSWRTDEYCSVPDVADGEGNQFGDVITLLSDTCAFHNLYQVNNIYNFTGRTLDLILSSDASTLVSLCEALVLADDYHPPLTFQILSGEEHTNSGGPQCDQFYYDFKSADLTLLNDCLGQLNWDEILLSHTVNYMDNSKREAPEHCRPSEEWQSDKLKDFSDFRQYIHSKIVEEPTETSFDEANFIEKANNEIPYLSEVIKYSQSSKIRMLQIITKYLDSIEPGESISVNLGTWVYAILTLLEIPLNPSYCYTIREFAKKCSVVRSNIPENVEETAYNPFNLYICLIAKYFNQLDLAD